MAVCASGGVPFVESDGSLFGFGESLEEFCAGRALVVAGDVLAASALHFVTMSVLAQILVVQQDPQVEARI